jgi:hypothetical protein
MKTTAKTILRTAGQLLQHRGTLAIFAALYAGLLAALYGFVFTREATVSQVLLTMVFLALAPMAFFILQATIIDHARRGRVGWNRALFNSGKLAVVTLPVIILGVGLFVILNRWQPQSPQVVFGPSWPADAGWSSVTNQAPLPSLHWPTLLFSTLRWLVFGVILPLLTIHLWIAALDQNWRALVRGGASAFLRRVRRLVAGAFAPESVLTYTVGLVLFALIPYALLFVGVPVKGTRTDFAVFIARLAVVFLLTLWGWVLTITTLARNAVEAGDKIDHADWKGLTTELQTQETSYELPRSGCALQPRVAVAATLGIEFQSASTPMGLRPLSPTNPNVAAEPATLGWRSKPLRGISHAMHSAAFLSIMGDF